MINTRILPSIVVVTSFLAVASGCSDPAQSGRDAANPAQGHAPLRPPLTSQAKDPASGHGEQVRYQDGRDDGIGLELEKLEKDLHMLRDELARLKERIGEIDGTIAMIDAGGDYATEDADMPNEPPETAEARASQDVTWELAEMDDQFHEVQTGRTMSRQSVAAIEDAMYQSAIGERVFIDTLSCGTEQCRLEVVLDGESDATSVDALTTLPTSDGNWYASASFDISSDANSGRRTVVFLSKSQ